MDAVNQSRLLIKPKPAKLTRLQKEARIGLLFISPWLIGFVILKALPILAAFILSLTDFHMLTPEATRFIGLIKLFPFLSRYRSGREFVWVTGLFFVDRPA